MTRTLQPTPTRCRTLQRLGLSLGARRGAARAETGSALISTLIFMVLLAGLALVLASVLLAQLVPGQLAAKSTRTVYAAEAGLQATLSVIRSVAGTADADGVVYGDPSRLPCTRSATVDGTGSDARYTATVSYFIENPAGQDDAWLAAHDLGCSATGGVSGAPAYALIVSEGQGDAIASQAPNAGDRTLSAIYQFKITNVNIPGGPIRSVGEQSCLSALAATAGAKIVYKAADTCTDTDLDNWIYATDYTVKLASTTAEGLTPLCITGPAAWPGGEEPTLLQPCADETDPARWNQLWSYEGGNRFYGQNHDIGKGRSAFCLDSGVGHGEPLGRYLSVGTRCGNEVPWGSFAADAGVGAGAAGYTTHQIVNYEEFGRCADVTMEQINAPYMIAAQCKQDPTGTLKFLHWNHKWHYLEPADGAAKTAPQPIWVNYLDKTSNRRCFETPSWGSGKIHPIFASCTGSDRQNWVRFGQNDDYATSYLFVDTYGRCLSVDPSVLHKALYSKLTVVACNGSTAQKWNAPSNANSSSFGSYRELG